MKAPQTLRWRVGLAMAALIAAALLVMAAVMIFGAARMLQAELDRHLHRDIEFALQALSWRDGRFHWQAIDHPEGDSFDTEPALEVWTVAAAGAPSRLLLRHHDERVGAVAAPRAWPAAAPEAAGYADSAGAGQPWRVATELRQVPGRVEMLWVRVLRSRAPMRAELARLAALIGAGALGVAALGAALAAWWTGRALRPLGELADRMRSINLHDTTDTDNAGAITSTAGTNEAGEVQALAREFNELLQRLRASHAEVDRFAADCAHELRTPLTALQLRAERLWGRLHGLPANAAEREPLRDAVGEIAEAADRMTVIIGRLLLLARASVERAPPPLLATAVDELVHRTIETLQPLAEQAGVAIRSHGEGGPALHDAGWLAQALQDLIHNALVHATPRAAGAPIEVRLHRSLGDAGRPWIHIDVLDRGPGPPAAGAARLSANGSGLGLRIAQRLMAAQQGQLLLLPREGGGTCARLALRPARP